MASVTDSRTGKKILVGDNKAYNSLVQSGAAFSTNGKNARGGIDKTSSKEKSGEYKQGSTGVGGAEQIGGGGTPVMNASFTSPKATKVKAPIVATSKLAEKDIADKKATMAQFDQDVVNHGASKELTELSIANSPKSESKDSNKEQSFDESIQSTMSSFGLGDSAESDVAQTPEEKQLADIAKRKEKVLAEQEKQGSIAIQKLNQIAKGVYPLNASEKALLDSTTQAFNSVIEAQKLANAAYAGQTKELNATLGINETATDQAIGRVFAAVSNGNAKIADLNGQLAGKIAELKLAFQKQDYEVVQGAWGEADKIFENRLATLTDMHNEIQDVLKAQQDALKAKQEAEAKVKEGINKIVLSAAKNGATPDVLEAMSLAGDEAEAIQMAGEYLQEGTGTVGEYLYYKRDALRNGQVPMGYNEYATMDANRKRSITNVNMGASGIPPALLSKVEGIAGQYDGEQIVKDYNTVATQVNYINSLGKDPTDDIARIYAFAKVMDPNSAVKEGEYDTVASYSQSLLDRYGLKGKRVFDNNGFLTDEARNFISKTLNGRLTTQKKTVDNVYKEYGRRIDKITGMDDGVEYLTDYSKGYDSDTGTQAIQDEKAAEEEVTAWVAQSQENEDLLLEMQAAAPNATMAELKALLPM